MKIPLPLEVKEETPDYDNIESQNREIALIRKRHSVSNSSKHTPKIPNDARSDKFAIKRLSQAHTENKSNSMNQYKGLDPKYYNDVENFKPNLDYSIKIDFNKEFIRHKRIICSMREFHKFDI